MKDEQINLKLSPEEKNLMKKAARNLNFETGGKVNISEAIRHSVKKYAETDLTKPELFFIDREAIKQVDANLSYGMEKLNAFNDEFYQLTGRYLTRDELETVFQAVNKLGSQAIIREVIREMILTKSYQTLKAKHPDLQITYDSVPDKDLTALLEIADQVNAIPDIKMRAAGVMWDCFQVNEGKVTIDENGAEARKNAYRNYARTPTELLKLQKVKKLCQVLNELLTDKDIIPEQLFSLVYFDAEARLYQPSGAYIKYNSTPHPLITLNS